MGWRKPVHGHVPGLRQQVASASSPGPARSHKSCRGKRDDFAPLGIGSIRGLVSPLGSTDRPRVQLVPPIRSNSYGPHSGEQATDRRRKEKKEKNRRTGNK